MALGTWSISSTTSEHGPAEMLNTPLAKARGGLASTQDHKKASTLISIPPGIFYIDGRGVRWPKAGAARVIPTPALPWVGFLPAILDVMPPSPQCRQALNHTTQAGRSHVFSPACSSLCASKHVSPLSFFCTVTLHTQTSNSSCLASVSKKQLVIVAALILKLGFPLCLAKRAYFSFSSSCRYFYLFLL